MSIWQEAAKRMIEEYKPEPVIYSIFTPNENKKLPPLGRSNSLEFDGFKRVEFHPIKQQKATVPQRLEA